MPKKPEPSKKQPAKKKTSPTKKKPAAAKPKRTKSEVQPSVKKVLDEAFPPEITTYPTGHPRPPVKKRMFDVIDKAQLKVNPPTTPLKESKTLKGDEYPKRSVNRTADPWTDLPERTRSYLKLWPYGTNIVVDRNALIKLQDFFVDIRELPLPDTLWKALNKFQDDIRHILELIPLADWDVQQQERFKENYEAFFPTYTCKCHTKKRRPKKLKQQDDEE